MMLDTGIATADDASTFAQRSDGLPSFAAQ